MPLKTCDASGNFVWSPHDQKPTYFVLGTATQQLDASFDSSSQLSVFSLNLNDTINDFSRPATLSSNSRYAKLLWDGPSLGDEGVAGILVAGSDKGDLFLYDPSVLIESGSGNVDDFPDLIVDHKTNHTGVVQALDFNKFQPNLLASGAAESDIFIWDLNKMETPMTPGTKSQPADDVLDLSWNYKVQHILASTFRNRCVVWDLRKSDPIIKLSESMMKMKSKSVRWHPTVSTRLCISSDDDLTPWLQVWDLRFATTPVITLSQGHCAGITGMDWCPHDPNALLSCGRDGQLFVWEMDPEANLSEWYYGHSLSEECPQGGLHSVQWCPSQPGLYAVTSFEFGIQMFSILGSSLSNQTAKKREQRRQRKQSALEDAFGMEVHDSELKGNAVVAQQQPDPVIRKAPNWLRRPCGASFGFGGRLVTFNSQQNGQVFSYQFVSDPVLAQRSHELSQKINSQNSQELSDLCHSRIHEIGDEYGKLIWQFLQAHLHASDTRGAFLQLLGLHSVDVNAFIDSQLSQHGLKPSDLVSTGTIHENGAVKENAVPSLPTAQNDNIDNFFENIPVDQSIHESSEASNAQSGLQLSNVNLHSPPGDANEKALCLALMTGQLTRAIDLLLLQERDGEALILAIASGQNHIYDIVKQKVLEKSLKSGTEPRLSTRLMSASFDRQWSALIQQCDLTSWREMLACIITYTDGEEFKQLCELLAERLENAGNAELALSACHCYIACGNVEQFAACWVKNRPICSPNDLQTVMELIMTLQGCVGNVYSLGETVSDLYYRYSNILINEGLLLPALVYLSRSKPAPQTDFSLIKKHQSLAYLLDRVYHGLGYPVPREILPAPPVKPFEVKRVQSKSAHRQIASVQNVNPTWNRPASSSISSVQGDVPNYPVPPVSNANSWNLPTAAINSFQAPPVPGVFPSISSQPLSGIPPPLQPAGLNSYAPVGPPQMRPPVQSHTGPPMHQPNFTPNNQFGQPAMPQNVFMPNPVNAANASHTSLPPPSAASNVIPAAMKKDMKGWNDPPLLPERYGRQHMLSLLEAQNDSPTNIGSQAPVVNNFYNPAAFASSAAPPSFAVHPSNAPTMVAPQPTGPPPMHSAQHANNVYPPAPSMQASSQAWTPNNAFLPSSDGFSLTTGPSNPPLSAFTPIAPSSAATLPVVPQVNPVAAIPKAELPPQYENLKIVLSDLCDRCKSQATNRQVKLKMEDVARRLETLYDLLRGEKLSSSVVEGLQSISYAAHQGDYSSALGHINLTIQSANFAEIRTFMPAIKVLMQTALQMYT